MAVFTSPSDVAFPQGALRQLVSLHMTITPLAAAAVPAGIAAVKLARNIQENQPFRQLLSQITDGAGATASVDEGSVAQQQLQEFHALVQQRLSDAGIRTTIRFEVTSDAQGNLSIAGNHPKRQEIEQALLGDPEIAAAFGRLSASHRIRSTATEARQFAEQYIAEQSTTGETPGVAAPTELSPTFSVTINGDAIEVS